AHEHEGRKLEICVRDLPKGDCDASLLKSVFVNLISNAIKFTAGKEAAVVEIGCLEQNGEAVFLSATMERVSTWITCIKCFWHSSGFTPGMSSKELVWVWPLFKRSSSAMEDAFGPKRKSPRARRFISPWPDRCHLIGDHLIYFDCGWFGVRNLFHFSSSK